MGYSVKLLLDPWQGGWNGVLFTTKENQKGRNTPADEISGFPFSPFPIPNSNFNHL
jgi:hypothetical protein